jgi:hypothetical protein
LAISTTIASGSTNYIQNTNTLQSGATAYPQFLYVGSSLAVPTADIQSIQRNGSTVMSFSSAVEITQPLQPSFSVQPSANLTDVTGDGTDYTVVWATEIFDQGSDFASNTFTAPVTGRYQLNIQLAYFQLDSDLHTFASVALITSNRTYASYQQNISKNTSHYETFSFSVLADMDAGDTVTGRASVSGSSKVVDLDNSGTFFSGSLIN